MTEFRRIIRRATRRRVAALCLVGSCALVACASSSSTETTVPVEVPATVAGIGSLPPLGLLPMGMISDDDFSHYLLTSDVDAAVEEISNFYSNYDSLRFVGPNLYVRHKRTLSESDVAALNAEFADIVVGGSIEVSEPSKAERTEGDRLEMQRLKLRFDKRSYGRLRDLINRLNRLGAA